MAQPGLGPAGLLAQHHIPVVVDLPKDVLFALGPYSHQIVTSGAQRQLFMAGQVGMTPDGQILATVAEQFTLVITAM